MKSRPGGVSTLAHADGEQSWQPAIFGELSVCMNFLRQSWKRVAGYGTNDCASTSTHGGTERWGEQFLKTRCNNRGMQDRDDVRLESVLQAATCGTENTRESEDYFGRVFYGGAGSGLCNGPTA